jgi:hypothetical protein
LGPLLVLGLVLGLDADLSVPSPPLLPPQAVSVAARTTVAAIAMVAVLVVRACMRPPGPVWCGGSSVAGV